MNQRESKIFEKKYEREAAEMKKKWIEKMQVMSKFLQVDGYASEDQLADPDVCVFINPNTEHKEVENILKNIIEHMHRDYRSVVLKNGILNHLNFKEESNNDLKW